jgi:tetratricopeptide (TPR) repeat protein
MMYLKRIVIAAALYALIATPSLLFADSFHWVDSDGFHSEEQITKVPLEHRKDLPMAKNRMALPFSEEEDKDGSMFVWFTLGQTGFDYPYINAEIFPMNTFYVKVDQLQPGDVCWWKGFMALYKERDMLLTAKGELTLKSLEKNRGRASCYRFAGRLTSEKPALEKPAPQKSLKEADDSIARLNAAASLPVSVKDDGEFERLVVDWGKGRGEMETLREKYPNDPQVLRRLGVLYRRGYNLDIPGAWERAEAYLLRVEDLAPDSPDAFISLGILYAATAPEYQARSEMHFRRAFPIARKDQLPQIWWGIAMSLHSQSKEKEALEAVDQYLAIRPKDAVAKQLRMDILKAAKKKKP